MTSQATMRPCIRDKTGALTLFPGGFFFSQLRIGWRCWPRRFRLLIILLLYPCSLLGHRCQLSLWCVGQNQHCPYVALASADQRLEKILYGTTHYGSAGHNGSLPDYHGSSIASSKALPILHEPAHERVYNILHSCAPHLYHQLTGLSMASIVRLGLSIARYSRH